MINSNSSSIIVDLLLYLFMAVVVVVITFIVILGVKVIFKYINDIRNKPPNIYDQMMTQMKRDN